MWMAGFIYGGFSLRQWRNEEGIDGLHELNELNRLIHLWTQHRKLNRFLWVAIGQRWNTFRGRRRGFD